MKFLRPALLGKVKASSINEDSAILWDLTLEEANNGHWLDGPLSPEDVTARHPGGWVPVRRFRVWQASGEKTKVKAD